MVTVAITAKTLTCVFIEFSFSGLIKIALAEVFEGGRYGPSMNRLYSVGLAQTALYITTRRRAVKVKTQCSEDIDICRCSLTVVIPNCRKQAISLRTLVVSAKATQRHLTLVDVRANHCVLHKRERTHSNLQQVRDAARVQIIPHARPSANIPDSES